MAFRTDENNNPTAFTTDIAKEAGLVEGVDYIQGEPFPPSTLVTAKLLGDPVEITIRVIDKIGFYTHVGGLRWSYVGMYPFVWDSLNWNKKRRVIGRMYQTEGGIAMKGLFK